MPPKRIHTTKVGVCRVSIYKDFGRYSVKTEHLDGRRRSFTGTYGANTKSDARATAAAEIKRLRKTTYCRQK